MAAEKNLIRCFLCQRKNVFGYKIEVTQCPASKKTCKEVLMHLARKSNTEIYIGSGDLLCSGCHEKLLEYDAAIVKLLHKQRNLAKLIEKAALVVEDSDLEQELDYHMTTLRELNDEHFFDDIQISDKEISKTISEALGDRITTFDTNSAKYMQNTSIGQLKVRKLLPCSLCNVSFKSKIRLQKHISKAHKKYSCELCNFSHRNEDYVLLHMNLHEGRKENQCRYCDKEFTTKISTIRHMEVHLNSKKYQCDKCGLCFSQTTILYNHKLQHEAEEKPLNCEICSQVFKTKRTYRHHMITHRADRPRHTCEYCGKTFTEKYTLKVHKRIHPEATSEQTDNSNQIVQTNYAADTARLPAIDPKQNCSCIICDQSFINKDHLNKHMEKEHDVILKSLTLSNYSQYEVVTNESKKPCHICGHMFSTQTNLDAHLEYVHGVILK